LSLAIVQEMAARLGAATGRGLLDLVRERFGIGWALVAVVVVVLATAAWVAGQLVRRHRRSAVLRSTAPALARRGEDPDKLERQAAAAERAGDLSLAVRLRFVAGLLRLDRAGVISYRPSLTTGQLVGRVPSADFGDLARAFDEIAYGGRPAAGADVDSARAGWPRVLEAAGRQ
jgi:hypothetical protein